MLLLQGLLLDMRQICRISWSYNKTARRYIRQMQLFSGWRRNSRISFRRLCGLGTESDRLQNL